VTFFGGMEWGEWSVFNLSRQNPSLHPSPRLSFSPLGAAYDLLDFIFFWRPVLRGAGKTQLAWR